MFSALVRFYMEIFQNPLLVSAPSHHHDNWKCFFREASQSPTSSLLILRHDNSEAVTSDTTHEHYTSSCQCIFRLNLALCVKKKQYIPIKSKEEKYSGSAIWEMMMALWVDSCYDLYKTIMVLSFSLTFLSDVFKREVLSSLSFKCLPATLVLNSCCAILF